jgi:hypothetical protein
MGLMAAARGAVRAVLAFALAALGAAAGAADARERFREANDLARGGDYPKAIALYGALAGAGEESASLYWNWAQAAAARGAQGEALGALLRGREIEPSDRAVGREIERLRQGANLDAAELAPEPLAAVARASRRFRLDLVAVLLLGLSLLAPLAGRFRPGPGAAPVAWGALALGLLAAAAPVAGSLARPTGVVVRRAAPLLDAASPTADAVGALREGEVVPLLERSGDYVRVEDSSGARGWAAASDVWRLDRPPAARP